MHGPRAGHRRRETNEYRISSNLVESRLESRLDTLTGPAYTRSRSFQLEFLTYVWSWSIASIIGASETNPSGNVTPATPFLSEVAQAIAGAKKEQFLNQHKYAQRH